MKNLSILFILVIIFLANPQKASLQKYKYGKVSKELLDMSECELDKEADAMITYISGDNSVLYSSSEGFYTVLKVKKQIKIFNQNAKDAGTNFITFYSPKGGRAKVKLRGLKGKTYNLENDKIAEIKLKDENIFETQINNYYKRVSLTMPNVQKNSVFEFEYELESEFYTNIDDWDLQAEYPVIYNEFYTSMPQYYKYQINITGPYAPTLDETNTYDELLQNSVSSSDRIKIPFTKRKIIYENLPSIGDEPYIANKSDIKAKITHQLILIDWPGQMIRNIATDYQGLSKSLLESSDFGSIIKGGDFIETFVDVKDVKNQLEIAEKVYQTFTEKIKWDGYNHYRSGFGGKKLFKEGKGDAGDINLNYIAALNHLGITTIPVIMSTRGNGTLHPQYPDYSDFDYVFAISSIGEKLYYSDATSGLPFGNLPLRCLNGSGWMVSDKASDWISTKKDFYGRHGLMTEITFLNNEQHYKCTESRSNFFAYSDYESLKYKDEFTFLKSKYNPDNLKVDSLAIIEKKPSYIKSVFLGHREIDDESLKYVFPFDLKPLKENPFKKESRNTIIDYPYLQDYRFVTTIEIKEDEIFEAPQNLNAALEENIITFKYNSNFNTGLKKLTLNAELKINKNEFLPDEYPEVKEAFETIINKLNEPVIIKKKR